MAEEILYGPTSLPAAVDLSGSAAKRSWVSVNGSGQAAVCAAGALPAGLLMNQPKSGEQARIEFVGNKAPKVQLGGTVAIGNDLMVGSGGLTVLATTGNIVIGTALEAGVSGQFVQVISQFRGTK